jgi:hypothetical protein
MDLATRFDDEFAVLRRYRSYDALARRPDHSMPYGHVGRINKSISCLVMGTMTFKDALPLMMRHA